MQPKQSKLLLWIGIGAIVLGLAVSAFGTFSFLHTSRNVALHQRIPDHPFLAEYEDDRNLAVLILVGGLLVLVAGGGCVLVYYIGRPSSSQDEGDEGDEERSDRMQRRPRKRR
jgi:flagellar basal body-associated protein FliL